MLGYGVSTALAARALSAAEGLVLAHAQAGAVVPMHVAFAAVFPAAALSVVFCTTLALGRAARLSGAPSTALRSATAGALAFLAVAASMDAIGWRVGAPGAEARFTMVVVLATALVATALAGAAVLGRALVRAAPRTVPSPVG
jgi:hypothetical protein